MSDVSFGSSSDSAPARQKKRSLSSPKATIQLSSDDSDGSGPSVSPPRRSPAAARPQRASSLNRKVVVDVSSGDEDSGGSAFEESDAEPRKVAKSKPSPAKTPVPVKKARAKPSPKSAIPSSDSDDVVVSKPAAKTSVSRKPAVAAAAAPTLKKAVMSTLDFDSTDSDEDITLRVLTPSKRAYTLPGACARVRGTF